MTADKRSTSYANSYLLGYLLWQACDRCRSLERDIARQAGEKPAHAGLPQGRKARDAALSVFDALLEDLASIWQLAKRFGRSHLAKTAPVCCEAVQQARQAYETWFARHERREAQRFLAAWTDAASPSEDQAQDQLWQQAIDWPHLACKQRLLDHDGSAPEGLPDDTARACWTLGDRIGRLATDAFNEQVHAWLRDVEALFETLGLPRAWIAEMLQADRRTRYSRVHQEIHGVHERIVEQLRQGLVRIEPEPPEPQRTYLTIPEAARYMRVGEDTVLRLIEAGQIAVVEISGKGKTAGRKMKRVRRDEIERYMREQERSYPGPFELRRPKRKIPPKDFIG